MNKLWEAIDVINERGWIQGALEKEDGVCILGAYRRAWGINPAMPWSLDLQMATKADKDMELLDQVAMEQFNKNGFVNLNDDPETTKADVILALEKAAIMKYELV